jgi:hypothetical protein
MSGHPANSPATVENLKSHRELHRDDDRRIVLIVRPRRAARALPFTFVKVASIDAASRPTRSSRRRI